MRYESLPVSYTHLDTIEQLLHNIPAILPGEDGDTMELTRAVGENLKRIRKSKKLSMERLAAEAGVSRSKMCIRDRSSTATTGS